ncbi:MAG: 3-deoxy-D-manno-octulosonic acid transferase, partial [Bacteroidales bacterium]|nr:3-deoxy-D-manno-octulosonic acid transferase [Bacteroidales bacterium]
LVVWIVSSWNRKAKLWLTGRRRWYEKLQPVFGEEDRVIWFHCASLGEFEQGRPIIEAIRLRMPHHKILLTFFSPSGYEKRKNYEGADHVMYLPQDTKRNAWRMLNTLSLEMAVFIKYEFWYHFLFQLKKQRIPTYLASGNFRTNQLFFQWYGGWYRKFLDCFTHIFVQQEHSRKLLEEVGIDRVSVAGDTRFDRVKQVAGTDYRDEILESFAKGEQVIVAGSTWEKDELALEYAFRELPDQVRWIIAPHELSAAHIQRLRKRFPSSVLFTELGKGISPETRVIIVDTIGQLAYLYRYGTLAYIGGGFGKGIHNILEAATYGLPVIFGPTYQKFSEAVELIKLGGAFPVLGERELLSTIRQQLENPDLLKTSSQISENYVMERVGATSTILDRVCKKKDVNML